MGKEMKLKDYQFTQIQVKDLFEVKVEIIQIMAGLDPTGTFPERELELPIIPVPPQEKNPWKDSPYWKTSIGAESKPKPFSFCKTKSSGNII